jgi:hypothetical protein
MEKFGYGQRRSLTAPSGAWAPQSEPRHQKD